MVMLESGLSGDESFQPIDCTNQQNTNSNTEKTKPMTNRLAMVNKKHKRPKEKANLIIII